MKRIADMDDYKYREDYDYGWSSFGVFADESGALFWTTDGGCSCNYAWEEPESYYDFTPATFAEIDAAAVSWAGTDQQPERVQMMRAVAHFQDTGEIAASE